MASPLQKLLRKSPAARLIAALYERPANNRITPIVVNKPHFPEIKPDGGGISDPCPFSASSETNFSTSSPMSQIYPSVPFGYCFNPVFSMVPALSVEENEGLDDSGKVWADSVKKKRKRKMNKHKYRKLRKRLRRQT